MIPRVRRPQRWRRLNWRLPFLRYDRAGINQRIEAITGAHACQGVVIDDPESLQHLDRVADVELVETLLSRRTP